MIDRQKIERINELARKKRTVGLTSEEAIERTTLHREYLEDFRNNLRALLETVEFDDENKQETTAVDVDDVGNPSNPTGTEGSVMLERMNEEHREMTDWALDFVTGLHPGNILDVGCGGGAALANLHQRFPEATLYGIDISEVSVLESLDYNRDGVIDGTVRINQGSVEDLPYGNDFFGLVISISSYFFWDDIDRALEEIRRVLKPGGTLLLISAIHKDRETGDEDFLSLPYVHNFLSEKDFREKLRSLGYDQIEIHTKSGERWICVGGIKS